MRKLLLVIGILVLGTSVFTFLEFQKSKNNCLAEIKNTNYEVVVSFRNNSSLDKVKILQRETSGFPSIKQSNITTAEESLKNYIEKHREDKKLLKQLNEFGENPLGPVLTILLDENVSENDIIDLQKTIEQKAQELVVAVWTLNNNFLNKNSSIDMLSNFSFYEFLLSKIFNFRTILLTNPIAPFLSFARTKCIVELL